MMKLTLIFFFTGLLLAFLSVFAHTNVDFLTILEMILYLAQGPFQMLLLGMVLLFLGTLLRKKTIR
jgi:hypothetical protein